MCPIACILFAQVLDVFYLIVTSHGETLYGLGAHFLEVVHIGEGRHIGNGLRTDAVGCADQMSCVDKRLYGPMEWGQGYFTIMVR